MPSMNPFSNPKVREGYKDGLTLRAFIRDIKNYAHHKKGDSRSFEYNFGVYGGVITFNSILFGIYATTEILSRVIK